MSDAVAPAAPLPMEDTLRGRFPDAVSEAVMAVDIPTFTVDPARVLEIAHHLKHDLAFTFPVLASGVDMKDRIDMVWHLLNPDTGQFVALRVKLERDTPRVASLTPVWAGMDWHEREAYDLLGILFDDHPDLRRILLPDDWEGFPLRKDYTAID
jgi:NADH-quinone oxidoreductase subunit C